MTMLATPNTVDYGVRVSISAKLPPQLAKKLYLAFVQADEQDHLPLLVDLLSYLKAAGVDLVNLWDDLSEATGVLSDGD